MKMTKNKEYILEERDSDLERYRNYIDKCKIAVFFWEKINMILEKEYVFEPINKDLCDKIVSEINIEGFSLKFISRSLVFNIKNNNKNVFGEWDNENSVLSLEDFYALDFSNLIKEKIDVIKQDIKSKQKLISFLENDDIINEYINVLDTIESLKERKEELRSLLNFN